jgi:tagatose-1,6-bisphosphate aldolase
MATGVLNRSPSGGGNFNHKVSCVRRTRWQLEFSAKVLQAVGTSTIKFLVYGEQDDNWSSQQKSFRRWELQP